MAYNADRTIEVSPSEWLRTCRQRAGLSQTALAQRVGVRQQTVSKWEKGAGRVHKDQHGALAEALGLAEDDVSWLGQMGGASDVHPRPHLRVLDGRTETGDDETAPADRLSDDLAPEDALGLQADFLSAGIALLRRGGPTPGELELAGNLARSLGLSAWVS